MSLPLVTVVIPAHNAASWLTETIGSVSAQTHPHAALEVVFVDDGSTDDSAGIASALLAKTDIAHRVLRQSSSRGPSNARNLGWRDAHGTWIQFLDADDRLEPSKIAHQVAAVRDASPAVAAAYSPWGKLEFDHGRWAPQTPWMDPAIGADALLDILSTDHFLQIGCLLFSRAWLERTNGFVEAYRLIEDVDLIMRVVMQGGKLQRVTSARPLAWYRQRAGSLSRQSQQAFVDGCLRNARMAERYWRERQELTPARARLVADVLFMGTRYYAEHDPATFRSLTRDIFALQPNFVPRGPASLRLLSRVVGYATAERCAVRYRRLRGTATS